MEETFTPEAYVKSLGTELINNFIKAGLSTQAVAIGQRESRVLDQSSHEFFLPVLV